MPQTSAAALPLDPPVLHGLGWPAVTQGDPAQDDHALVARANRGDAAAFERLYERHREWVLAVAYRFTSNREDSLDVLQETFAYFYGKFPGFELTTNLRGFLFPAVKHLALGRKRKESLSEHYAELAERRLSVQPETPDDLEKLLQELPEGQREVLWLRFHDDMKLKDIATALGLPLGTVKSRLHLALQALRAAVDGSEVATRPRRKVSP